MFVVWSLCCCPVFYCMIRVLFNAFAMAIIYLGMVDAGTEFGKCTVNDTRDIWILGNCSGKYSFGSDCCNGKVDMSVSVSR